MERYTSARALIDAIKPDRPVFGIRPHAAGRAAQWFLKNFPGEVAYAYKANHSVFMIGALFGAGITQFDVASIPELEDAATIPGVRLHFMHPVKSRAAIRLAYHEYGIRCFALDTEDELAQDPGGDRRGQGPAAVRAHRGAGQEQPRAARAQVRHHRAEGGAAAGQDAAGGRRTRA